MLPIIFPAKIKMPNSFIDIVHRDANGCVGSKISVECESIASMMMRRRAKKDLSERKRVNYLICFFDDIASFVKLWKKFIKRPW